jgi:hypothetical protein
VTAFQKTGVTPDIDVLEHLLAIAASRVSSLNGTVRCGFVCSYSIHPLPACPQQNLSIMINGLSGTQAEAAASLRDRKPLLDALFEHACHKIDTMDLKVGFLSCTIIVSCIS